MLIKYAPDFIKKQGAYGSCAAQALAGWAQAWYKKTTGKVVEMSSGYIMAYSRPFVPDENTGGLIFPRDLDAFLKCGTCPSSEFEHHSTAYGCYLAAEAAKDRIKTIIRPIGYKSLGSADKQLQLSRIKEYLDKHQMPLFVSAKVANYNHAVLAIGVDGEDVICLDSDNRNWRVKYSTYDINKVYHIWGEEIGLNFKDVNKDDWAYPAIKYAYENGLMQGTSNDTFEPNKPLTRAEMAQILYNMGARS